MNYRFSDEGQLTQPIKMFKNTNKETSRDKIVKLAQLHDELTDIVGLVNQRFSVKVIQSIDSILEVCASLPPLVEVCVLTENWF